METECRPTHKHLHTTLINKEKKNMHKQESSALNITRFIMSIGIVFLHSYTSVQMYPSLGELTVYQQITRVLSMQFGEMSVPTIFLI